MGAGASSAQTELAVATPDQIATAFAGLPTSEQEKVKSALAAIDMSGGTWRHWCEKRTLRRPRVVGINFRRMWRSFVDYFEVMLMSCK